MIKILVKTPDQISLPKVHFIISSYKYRYTVSHACHGNYNSDHQLHVAKLASWTKTEVRFLCISYVRVLFIKMT